MAAAIIQEMALNALVCAIIGIDSASSHIDRVAWSIAAADAR